MTHTQTTTQPNAMSPIPASRTCTAAIDTVTIEQSFATAVAPSPNVLQTACMFGLGVDAARTLAVVPRTEIPLPPLGVIFITGPSGGGKSTILRLIAEKARESLADRRRIINFDELTLSAIPDRPLVDVFDLPLEKTTALLARAGLGDAFVMLRRPQQLSDGQRYRLRLAIAMHEAERWGSMGGDRGDGGGRGERRESGDGGERGDRSSGGAIVLADEFGATLDRTTARVIARSVRSWTRRAGCTFIAATTHDDLLEAFEPDVLIVKGLGESIEVLQR
jgi:uncharacterized protein